MAEPIIKVTKINDRYHARCYIDGVLADEMACKYKQDIGVICRIMLRWLHKLGISVTNYTDKARHRKSTQRSSIGLVWYKRQLDREKEKIRDEKERNSSGN